MNSSRGFFRQVKEFKKYIINTLELKDDVKLIMSKKHNKALIHYFREGAKEEDIYRVSFIDFKGQISNDRSICNACVDTDNKILYFPVGDRLIGDKWNLLSTLAHEYAHVWQSQRGLELNEYVANALAITLINDFFGKTIYPIMDGVKYELCEACSIHVWHKNIPVCCVCEGKMIVPVEEE